jgi:hypothetical protein
MAIYIKILKKFFFSRFGPEFNRVHYYWGPYCPILPAPDDDEFGDVGG